MMNAIVKNSLISTIAKTYPGVLFISVNVAAKEMQLHYQSKVITESSGAIVMNHREAILKMLDIRELEKVHIYVEQKIITFYGDGKEINL